jgi:hypothetical protein
VNEKVLAIEEVDYEILHLALKQGMNLRLRLLRDQDLQGTCEKACLNEADSD